MKTAICDIFNNPSRTLGPVSLKSSNVADLSDVRFGSFAAEPIAASQDQCPLMPPIATVQDLEEQFEARMPEVRGPLVTGAGKPFIDRQCRARAVSQSKPLMLLTPALSEPGSPVKTHAAFFRGPPCLVVL